VSARDSLVVTGILRVDGNPPLNRFDFVIDALTVDTEVAVGATPTPDMDTRNPSWQATDETRGGDVKSVLDSHWRQAVEEGGEQDHQPTPFGSV
ncbi:MAG: hypothetical protein R3324_22255, partial [Halobacteriales archaeon]|nr:hypothetical protein [Halobacteriales archaeon]